MYIDQIKTQQQQKNTGPPDKFYSFVFTVFVPFRKILS